MTDEHDLTDPHGEAEALRRENERLRGANAAWVINFENVFAEGAKQKARAEKAEAECDAANSDRDWARKEFIKAADERDAALARIADLEAQLAALTQPPDAELDALVARLRTITSSGCNPYSACHEAASAITALRAQPDWKAMAERLGEAAAVVTHSYWYDADVVVDGVSDLDAALSDLAKMKGE